MNKATNFQKAGFLFTMTVFFMFAAGNCSQERKVPVIQSSSGLSYRSDPAGLPVEGLIDDWFFLHQEEDPSAFSRDHVKKIVGHLHALGEVDASTFDLLEAIDSDQVDSTVYPSLANLDREERTATLILAVLELTEEFEGDWSEVVRLVYGGQKTVLEVAEALNEAKAFPVPNEDLDDLSVNDHGLVCELARGYDKMSGCSSNHCRANSNTTIENAVVQLLVAYRAGVRAKHMLGDQGPREYLWLLETEAELNLLMYLLGDHEPPDSPVVNPVPSPTALNPIVLTGTAEALSFIGVSGGQSPAASETDRFGAFSVEVMLCPNQQNVLSVTATDRAGNTSVALEVIVLHDNIPPVVEITNLSPSPKSLIVSEQK